MTVFVLFQDQDGFPGFEGVFSTRENARTFAESRFIPNDWFGWWIVEYTLDVPAPATLA